MDNISVFANLNTLPFATSICSYTPQYNYSSEEEEEQEGLQIFGREKNLLQRGQCRGEKGQ